MSDHPEEAEPGKKSKMSVKNVLVVVFLAFFFIFNMIVILHYSVNISTSPDSVELHYFINEIARTGGITNRDNIRLNREYDNVFSPRGVVVNDLGEIVPMKAIGNIMYYGTYYRFFTDIVNIQEFMSLFDLCIFFLFSIFFYLLITKIFNMKKGVIPYSIMLLILYLFNFDTSIITINSFFLIVFFYFLYGWVLDKASTSKMILCGIALINVILTRYEMIVLLLPIYGYCLYVFFHERNYRILILYLSVLVAAFVVMCSFNYLYHNPLTTGYSLQYSDIPLVGGNGATSSVDTLLHMGSYFMVYGFDVGETVHNILNYIVFLVPLLLFSAILVAVVSLKNFKNKGFWTAVVLFCVYILVYYGSNDVFFGHDQITLQSSYVRYFSIVYLFLFVLSFSFFFAMYKLLSTTKLKMILLSLLLSLIMIGTLAQYDQTYRGLARYRDQVIPGFERVIPENSVVFTTYWDKLLYDKYLVATPGDRTGNISSYFGTLISYYYGNNRSVVYIPTNEAENEIFVDFIAKSGLHCEYLGFAGACLLSSD